MGDVINITATMTIQMETPQKLSPGQTADLMEDVSAHIRQAIAGKQIWSAYVVAVDDLKIKSIE